MEIWELLKGDMEMSLADLYSKLEALENGSDFVAEVKKEVANLSSEAKKHRETKETVETKLLELKNQLEEAKNTSTNKQTKLQELETQVNMLTEKYEEAEKARQSEQNKRIKADINAKVIDALTKGNAMDPVEIANLHINKIKVDEQGNYLYQTEQGDVSVADGITSWLTSHPWAVKSTQKAGSGAGGSNASGNTITKEDFKKMGYGEKTALFTENPDLYNQLSKGE